MSKADVIGKPDESIQLKPLRLWPGVIIVAFQWFIRFVYPAIVPNGMMIAVMGGMASAIAVIVWWIFFSRAHRIERFGAIILIIASLYGTSFLLDKSIATANMGLMFIIYSIPVMCLAFVLWAVATHNLSTTVRRVTMILTILSASGMWILLRTNGMTGEGQHDIATGKPRWFGTDGGSGYSSPQLLTINGVLQVLLMSKAGVLSVDPATGKKLWDYPWPLEDRVLQPALLENGDLIFAEEYKNIRCVSVTNKGDEWKIRDLWTSPGIKSVFNDQVIHKGYAYGFDGPYIACVDLKDGKRMWRGGRYQGFTLLLADQDIILVLTEKGEVALVSASLDKLTELSRFQAISGKTWNHPALDGFV